MVIIPKSGIDKLLFGMKLPDVAAIYGKPDREYRDEDDNMIALFNGQKMRLTFYADEDLRLGYIIASDADLVLLDNKVIGRKYADVHKNLSEKGLVKWTQESYDTYTNWFNEDHWIVLQTEFGDVVKVELGAIINDKDDFDWKFKGK